MTAPSLAAVRMRRTRERRRQGDVIVSLEVGPKVTADLVELGCLPAPDRGDKDALTRALIELVERALGYPALFVSAERHGKPLGAKSTPLSMAKTPDSLAFPKRKTPDKSLSLER